MTTEKKKYCETSERNFSVEGMFFIHRVGKDLGENIGFSTGRGSTDEEMYAKRWLLHSLRVKVYVDGSPTTTMVES